MTGPDPQRQFVPVPVPSEYVTHVMAYIGLLDGQRQPTVGPDPGSVEEALAAEEVADADTADQQWSVEDLRRLARGNTFTTQVLTDILDVLAAQPGTWMTSVELAAETN